MKILLTILLISIQICRGQGIRPEIYSSKKFENFYSSITQQFITIDSLRKVEYDSLAPANDKIIEIIKAYKADLLNFPDSLDYDLVYLIKSPDRKLALISWDTRTGGTMIAFTTMAVYQTQHGIQTKMLLDTTDDDMPYTYMHYNSITTLTTVEGNNIYLAWGNGQGSTLLPWQELRAISIVNDDLSEPKIFPGNASKIFVEFDLHAFRDDQKIPVIRVVKNGRTIKVPIENSKQGFSGKYKTYTFNGKVYKTK